MFVFHTDRQKRRLGLTPMIDVVFLLLVFFMLTAQFTRDQSIPLLQAVAGNSYSGPPRLVRIGPDALWLNGQPVEREDLVAALTSLTTSHDDTIVLRGTDETGLQPLVETLHLLGAAGFSRLVLVD